MNLGLTEIILLLVGIGIPILLVLFIVTFIIISAKRKQADRKACPFCAERVKLEAKVCRFCGRDIV